MSLSVELQRLKEMEYTLHIRDVSWNGFLLTPEGKALKRAVNDQRKLVQQLQEEASCTPTPTSSVPATSSDSSSSARA